MLRKKEHKKEVVLRNSTFFNSFSNQDFRLITNYSPFLRKNLRR